MRSLLAAVVALLVAVPAWAQWTRVDTNYGLTAPYKTDLLGADATTLYALVLEQAATPAVWSVLRSADDGDSWSAVRSIPSSGNSVEAAFLGDLDGLLVAALPTTAGTVVHLSENRGTTWTEATPVPSSFILAFARDGDHLLATGYATYRSPDRGVTWQPIGGGMTNQAFPRSVRFAGAFWAATQGGFLHRLPDAATAWEQPAGAPAGVLSIWLDGATLWAKGRASLISPLTHYATTDGITWTPRAAASPADYRDAYPAPPDADPWFLTSEASIGTATHFLSTDDGVSLTDITTGYPRSSNGYACVSVYTATGTAAVGATTGGVAGASGCTPGTDPDAGVYRYTFGGASTAEGTPGTEDLTIRLARNPTSGGGAITIRQREAAPLDVALYDALGRRTAQLAQGTVRVGATRLMLPQNLASGVYIVHARAGVQHATQTVTVIR